MSECVTVPRVLSPGEVFAAKNVDVWLEETDQTQVHPLMLVEAERGENYQLAYFWPRVVRVMWEYGKDWRVWTARPTEEQRRRVKWDE